ncbi:MAG: hypothetical protein U0V73_11885 [Acidimicrobiia bacterium]
MTEELPDLNCPRCAADGEMFPTVVMTPGGPDRLVAVCAMCGTTEDLGALDAEEAA